MQRSDKEPEESAERSRDSHRETAASKTRRSMSMAVNRVPHSAAIGIELLEIGGGSARVRVPYAEHLIGDPSTGVVHGGVLTAALDNASGMAVHSRLERATSIATLDLRIDYMRPATPKQEIVAEAHCYEHTRNIAFVRGVAYHDDPEDPIATTTATFVISSNETRKLHAGVRSSRKDGEASS